MAKYKIIKDKEVRHVFSSNQSLALVMTNPALYFLCDGNYKVERCGQKLVFKQIINHLSMLINNRRKYNAFTK